MTEPLFVSFFTPSYRHEVQGLAEDLEVLGLDHLVEQRVDLGSWYLNTRQKPAYVAEKLIDNPGRPVVWLDADCRVRRRPGLLFELAAQGWADLAAHRFDWRRPGRPLDLLSGTVYFGNTGRCRRCVDRWRALCEDPADPQLWDQVALQQAMAADPRIAFRDLPLAYCFVFDIARRMYPGVEPVVEHFQASRRHRA